MDYSSDIKTIETNVVIAEEEGTFFKEVDFDFDSMPSEVYMKNPGARIFMVNNIDEKIEVKAYPTKGEAVMFNAWITKNIAYKVAGQDCRGFYDEKFPCDNYDSSASKQAPRIFYETIGTGISDKEGYPTVFGPVYHMTKVINFGGCIVLCLPRGEKLKETDKVEVVSAEIIGTHDEPRVMKQHHFL